MYTIKIEEYKIDVIIGCYPHERQKEQTIVIDLELKVAAFVDYEKVMDLFKILAKEGKYLYLERLSDDFLNALFQQFPIASAKIKISKPGALPEAKNVYIEVER